MNKLIKFFKDKGVVISLLIGVIIGLQLSNYIFDKEIIVSNQIKNLAPDGYQVSEYTEDVLTNPCVLVFFDDEPVEILKDDENCAIIRLTQIKEDK